MLFGHGVSMLFYSYSIQYTLSSADKILHILEVTKMIIFENLMQGMFTQMSVQKNEHRTLAFETMQFQSSFLSFLFALSHLIFS